MKHFALLLAAVLAPLCTAFAQSIAPAPGGVPGAKMWLATQRQPDGTTAWADRAAPQTPQFKFQEKSDNTLNFNPAPYFNGSAESQLSIPASGIDFSRASLFTVCQPTDSATERIMWSLEKNGQPHLMLTSDRMADLASAQYMNFVGAAIRQPRLHSYAQRKERDLSPPQQQELRFGSQSEASHLPVQPFRGSIPEFVAYDRVLSAPERAQVETYLALKYGLDRLGADYLSPSGEVIWDAAQNADYPHHIVGIGRDDHSVLYQRQSASSSNPRLLVLGAGQITATNAANPAELPDGAYLLWGDNHAPLAFGKKQQGQPRHLARRWKTAANHWPKDLKTALRFDTRQLETPLADGETLWLSTDRSTAGAFAAGETDYRAGVLDAQGFAVFQDLLWDTDGSGGDRFTLSAGPTMMATAWLTPPRCAGPTDGTLHIGAMGGTPPYQFELVSTNASFREIWENKTAARRDVAGLPPGDYTLTVRDAAGHFFQEKYYLESADAPRPPLAERYELRPEKPLDLDASLAGSPAGVAYQWFGPDGLESTAPQVSLTQPGQYRLTVDSAGCTACCDIEVVRFVADNFESVTLAPNPVAAGTDFQVKIQLRRPADTELLIHDAAGRLVLAQTLRGSDRYVFSPNLSTAGAYVATLRSEGGQRAVTVVVE